MKSLRFANALALLWLVLPTLSCSEVPERTTQPREASESVRVVALAPTAHWLLSEIAEPGTEVVSLWAEGGRDLEPEELQSLLDASWIVRHGAGLDRWADTLEIDPAHLVDLSRDVELIEREGTRHSHGEEGEHAHAEPLPATWHDPALLLQALETLAGKLSADDAGTISSERLDSLRSRVLALDARLTELAASVGVATADDELAYLARRLAAEETSGIALQMTAAGEAGLVLEALLPPPSDGNYLALFERNLDRIASAAAAPP